MKSLFGFAVVVFTISLCSASLDFFSNGKERITILMDDDLLDRHLTISPNVKYTVQMKSKVRRDYRLSVSVILAECMDYSLQISFKSLRERNVDNEIHNGILWNCEPKSLDTESATRIYDSSTSSLEISVSDSNPDVSIKFLITAYLEIEDGECPPNFVQCSECEKLEDEVDDDSESLERSLGESLLKVSKGKSKRCIPADVTCNGRDNCANCDNKDKDESNCSAGNCPANDECLWSGFHDSQYMLTILLAGLFFIMSPIVIVLVLFYHKSMSPSARQREILRARERNSTAEAFTISQGPLRNDRPPAYEDVHDTKSPPPNFDDVVLQQTSEVGLTNTNIPPEIISNV